MKQRHPFRIYALAWSPDGLLLAVGGHSKRVSIWEVASQRQVGIMLHKQPRQEIVYVGRLAWSPDGTRLASAGGDKTVRLWEAATGNLLLTYHDHQQIGSGDIQALAWSPDGRLIATGDWGDTLRVWEAASGIPLWTSSTQLGRVMALAWSPDGQRLALLARTPYGEKRPNGIQVWEASSSNLLWKVSDLAYEPCAAVWSPDGTRLLVLGFSPGHVGRTNVSVVQEWEASAGQPLESAEHPLFGWDSGALIWLPGERPQVAAHGGTEIEVWKLGTNQHFYTYRGHRAGIGAVAWSPDGKRIASGSYDKTVQIWEPPLDPVEISDYKDTNLWEQYPLK